MGALALLLVGAGSCTDGTTTTVAYAYDNPYVYTTYYPVDTAYAGYYWADSWNYYSFYYAAVGVDATGLASNLWLGRNERRDGERLAERARAEFGAAGMNGSGGRGRDTARAAVTARRGNGTGGAGGGRPARRRTRRSLR